MELETVTRQVFDEEAGGLISTEVDAQRVAAFDAALRHGAGSLFAGQAHPGTGMSIQARDAQEALVFLVSQLAYTEQKVQQRRYQPTQYERFLPISYEAGPYADTIRYEIEDQVGQAYDISPAADDIPEVDAGVADKSFPVITGSVGYSWNQDELLKTAFLRRPLSERRLATAMATYKRRMNTVGLFGNAARNVTGLYNNANIAHATRPSGKAWTVASGITGAEVNADFNYAMNAVWTSSSFTAVPNMVIVPSPQFAFINSTPMSATFPNITILQYIKANNLLKSVTGEDVEIVPGYGLDTAGAGSTPRAVYYRKDDDVLVMHIPMPLQFLAPQLEGLKVRVPGWFKYSGTEVRHPTCAYYQDGL